MLVEMRALEALAATEEALAESRRATRATLLSHKDDAPKKNGLGCGEWLCSFMLCQCFSSAPTPSLPPAAYRALLEEEDATVNDRERAPSASDASSAAATAACRRAPSAASAASTRSLARASAAAHRPHGAARWR